jgi:hypothetical protein
MTITKKLLKDQLEACKNIIEGLKAEIEQYPQTRAYNEKSILKLEGKIEVYKEWLNK